MLLTRFFSTSAYAYTALSTYPDIELGSAIALALKDLGCSIGRTPTPRGQLVTRREEVAEAEVGDLDVHVCIQKEVLSLW